MFVCCFAVSVENEGFDMAVGSWQKKQEFTDVVFVVGDREFPAHKMVLASQSEYFKSMLYGQMKEASSERIKLSEENITPDAFEKIVQYVYTKSLEITEPFQVSIYAKMHTKQLDAYIRGDECIK